MQQFLGRLQAPVHLTVNWTQLQPKGTRNCLNFQIYSHVHKFYQKVIGFLNVVIVQPVFVTYAKFLLFQLLGMPFV